MVRGHFASARDPRTRGPIAQTSNALPVQRGRQYAAADGSAGAPRRGSTRGGEGRNCCGRRGVSTNSTRGRRPRCAPRRPAVRASREIRPPRKGALRLAPKRHRQEERVGRAIERVVCCFCNQGRRRWPRKEPHRHRVPRSSSGVAHLCARAGAARPWRAIPPDDRMGSRAKARSTAPAASRQSRSIPVRRRHDRQGRSGRPRGSMRCARSAAVPAG